MSEKLKRAIIGFSSVCVLALAILVPLRFIWGLEGSTDARGTSAVDADAVSANNHADGISGTLSAKMQIVARTSAGKDGYSRVKSDKLSANNSGYDNCVEELLERLLSSGCLDGKQYESIIASGFERAVTCYDYFVEDTQVFQAVVVDRSYFNIGICGKIDISIGLDRDTLQVLYMYVNFYRLSDDFLPGWYEESVKEKFVQEIPLLLGISADDTVNITVNQLDGNKRSIVVLNMADSSEYMFTLGISYSEAEERHQMYVAPYN